MEINPPNSSGQEKCPLWVYVIAVIVVLAIINFFIRSQNIFVFSDRKMKAGLQAAFWLTNRYKVLVLKRCSSLIPLFPALTWRVS
jgi:hypothetical protein